MQRPADYYMDLPCTVRLERGGKQFRAYVEELPGCHATVGTSEGVEETWGAHLPSRKTTAQSPTP